MLKKLMAVLVSALLLTAVIPISTAEETKNYIMADFSEYEEGAMPDELECFDGGGSVLVEKLQNNNVLSLTNDSDGAYTKVSKKFDEISGLSVTASVAFMQKEIAVNGNVLMELSCADGCVVSIETLNGDIIYRTGEKTYEVLVERYIPNFWYNIAVKLNLAEKTANVYVNNIRTIYMGSLISEAAKIDTFMSYTAYSPGYYLDNICITTSQEAERAELIGSDLISIPKSGVAYYKYTASVFDALGLELKTYISFKTEPASISGVVLKNTDKDGNPLEKNEVYIAVDSMAQGLDFVLTATAEAENTVTKSKNIALKSAQAEKITILGSAQISGELKQKFWDYSAVCYDGAGYEIEGESFVFSLEAIDGQSIPEGISIDADTGRITVSEELSGVHQKLFKIKATSKTNPEVFATKNIKVLNKEYYISDEARLNVLIDYADLVLEKGRDIYNGTPLLADGIDVGTGLHFEWQFPKESAKEDSAVLSNLADQGGLMRFLETLSELTGDPKYKNKVMEIYEYFLKVGISPSGMPYWGGHTCIDLKTGKVLYSPNDTLTHELKDHYPYMDPFYEIDTEAAVNIVKSIWASHIGDFGTMIYNRHGGYNQAPNIGATWDNLDCFDESITGHLKTTDLPFRFTANDFIYMAADMYAKTGDEKAKTWAYRLWTRYANVCHPETHMGGDVFTTAKDAPGTLDIMQAPPVGHWWDATPFPENYTWSSYGDRAYNQLAEPLYEAGYITKEQMDEVLESNMVTGFSIPAYTPQTDLYLAKTLGYDTEEGRRVLNHNTKMLGSFVYYGYIPETNMIRPMLYDGTDLSGYIFERQGYYGAAGKSFSQYPATQSLLFSLIASYNEAKNLTEEELTCKDTKNPGKTYNAKDEIYKMLRNLCKNLNLGDIGDENGNNISLNFSTECSHPKAAYALAELYKSTGRTDYLDLARVVANNVLKDHYAFGVFRKSLNYVNANFSIQNEWYYMALISIEAISRGEADLLPRWMPYNGYWSCDLLKPDGTVIRKAQAPWTAWSYTYNAVEVTDIIPQKMEYEMTVGEKIPLKFTVEPEDAANKEVDWQSDDMTIARYDSTDGTIYAAKAGETILRGYSADLKVKADIRVIVKEEEN